VSKENVETVKAGFEAFERGGVEALLDYVHPEFETTTPRELTTEPDTYRGHEGLRRYFDSFYEVMEDIRFLPEEFIEAGERVMVPIRLLARGRETGIEVEQRSVQVWTVRGGKAIVLQTFASREEALEAVGGPRPPS
jgi:ketosteroid isomerase-like protein